MLMPLFLSWEREFHFPLRCHDLHSQRVAVVNHLTSTSSASKTPLIHVASMIDIGSAFLMDGTHQCYHNRRRSYSSYNLFERERKYEKPLKQSRPLWPRYPEFRVRAATAENVNKVKSEIRSRKLRRPHQAY